MHPPGPSSLLGDLLAVAGGVLAFNHLLATMSRLLVSLIILLEIPGAALLAAVFLDETLPAGTYAGLALILVGLAVGVAGQRSGKGARGKPPTEPALVEPGTDRSSAD